MTEQEWHVCSHPQVMLDFIRERISDRKLRWFACACVREVWSCLLDERSLHAVEVSERYADGQASAADLAGAEVMAYEVARIADLHSTVTNPTSAAARAVHRAAGFDALSAASGAASTVATCAAPWAYDLSGTLVHRGDPAAKDLAHRRQCDLLREIVGNPFRRIDVQPDWLAWNQQIVPRLAEHVYLDGCWDELPILGDALEEAGCREEVILRHCHEPGGHVRGCWVVDLLLAKN
jgi:hypothetical protein